MNVYKRKDGSGNCLGRTLLLNGKMNSYLCVLGKKPKPTH